MQAVTFYTDKDIHQQVMNCFEHKAELKFKTIYLSPKTELSEKALNGICKTLSNRMSLKKYPKVFYLENKQLIVLTCHLIKNTINCTVRTRKTDILQLDDMLEKMYDDTSLMNRLILKHKTTPVNGFLLDVYRNSPKDKSVNIFGNITVPLALQLVSFMDNC